MLIDHALQIERMYRIIHQLNLQIQELKTGREEDEREAEIEELKKEIQRLNREKEKLKKQTQRDAGELSRISKHLDSLKVPKGPLITRIRKLRKTPVQ